MAPQPFVPLANGAQVEFIHTLLGEVVECRLWFVSRFVPIDNILLPALAAGASAWWRTDVLPYLAVELQLTQTVATDWTASPSPLIAIDSTVQDGNISGGVHSANVSIRVRFNGDNSQTFRDNSNFVPGIPLDAVNGNYYTTAIRNRLFDAYVHLIDLAGTWTAGNDWQWVITSRRFNYIYRATQLFARTDIITLPSPVISPRRRRLPRP